ncbi:MAG: hypothetical protein J6M95_02850 [Bacilli bacterium]|nr:hypothetical protein [Bacilli bacterium]
MKKKILFSLITSTLLFSCASNNDAIKNSKWGEEAAKASYDAIGVVIPYIESEAFEYEVITDAYGDLEINFYLYYESQEVAENKLVEYAYACYEQDRYQCEVKNQYYYDETDYSYFEAQTLYADKVLNEEVAVEILGIASQKAYNGVLKGCLGLFCYTYLPNLNPSSFPNNAVKHLLGEEIPALNGENLEFDFSFYIYGEGYSCLTISVAGDGASYLLEEEYISTLLSASYDIYPYNSYEETLGNRLRSVNDYQGYEDGFYYYAYPGNNNYMIVFYYSLYYSAFIIDIALL